MPLATVHLLALSPNASISSFLRAIAATSTKPLVAARVVRWIIKPNKLSASRLLANNWDLLLILPASSSIPEAYLGKDWLSAHWTITAGVPRSLIDGFAERNRGILRPDPANVPKLTGSLNKPRMTDSAQGLELDNELLEWSKTSKLGDGAVSMLNLLAFKPGKTAHEHYLKYGKAFAESIGSRRGGNAKIVGKVVANQGTEGEDTSGWDEIALAHYPSIHHFVDMIASEDYQKVNHEHRLLALRDTMILCTDELSNELSTDKARL